jgi:hypothetical protein
MVEIIRTPGGDKTAVAGNMALFSRYDPAREAGRFAADFFSGAKAGKNPATVVLLGAGLGYLENEIKKSVPASRLIAVYYDELLCAQSSCRGDAWHSPASRETVEAFFRNTLPEHDVEGLAILEWPASAKAFPEASRAAHRALSQVVRENAGNVFTTIASGKQWIRNTLFNFINVDNPKLDFPGHREAGLLVIAASGPSLAEALSVLKAHRDTFTLWALPSSCLFL